jgi:hypothetical protein
MSLEVCYGVKNGSNAAVSGHKKAHHEGREPALQKHNYECREDAKLVSCASSLGSPERFQGFASGFRRAFEASETDRYNH